MSSRLSPFATMSGADHQIKWLEYQSIRLPYVEGTLDNGTIFNSEKECDQNKSVYAYPETKKNQPQSEKASSLPKHEFSRSNHNQYAAVVAKLKQAELQSRRYQSQLSE